MHGKPYWYKESAVDRWAEYVISNDDWSKIQADFINAQVKNANDISSK